MALTAHETNDARTVAPARVRAAVTPPFHVGPGAVARSVELAVWAESVGYDVWLADAGGVDALTLAAIVLERTERVRVGIAVVPAYTRTPAVVAATVATLADLAPGRFALGLGTSSETMIEGWHGLRLDRPLARMRETLVLLRTMLSGQRTDFTGETLRSTGYQQPPPAESVPILLAALGPRMVDLAGTSADGVILNLAPLAALDDLVAGVRTAEAAAGRRPGDVEISSRFQALITDDPTRGYDAFRWRFTPYYANPVYNRSLAAAGYSDEAQALLTAARRGDWRAARAALTDEIVDAVAIVGDREHCRERLRSIVRLGITTPILFCLSDDPDAQRDTFLSLAPDALEVAQ